MERNKGEKKKTNIIFTKYSIKEFTGSVILSVKFSILYDFIRPNKCILEKENDQKRSPFGAKLSATLICQV